MTPRPAVSSALALLAAACAVPAPAPPVQTAPAATRPAGEMRIAMDILSWGKLTRRWEVDGSGNGIFQTTRDVPGGGFRDYDVLTRNFAVGPEAFARLRESLRPAEAFAGRPLDCELLVTDGPYGSVTWTGTERPGSVHYTLGCSSKQADAVQDVIFAAEALVATWAKDAPVAGVEEVREPR